LKPARPTAVQFFVLFSPILRPFVIGFSGPPKLCGDILKNEKPAETPIVNHQREEQQMSNLGQSKAGAILGLTLAMATSAALLVPSAAYGDMVVCDLSTLKGQYLVYGAGKLFPPAFGVIEVSVSTAAGYSTYNGDGTGEDHVTFVVNGVNTNVPSPQQFTYTLNPDCTGTRTVLHGGPQFNLFVASNGEALTEVATAPVGFAVATIDTRFGEQGAQ
jgi:hypothetical protein